jgi:hypothetical protein
VLRVECTKCDRKGRYSVAKLIEKHGRKGNMISTPTARSGMLPGCMTAATRCAPICRRYCEIDWYELKQAFSVAGTAQLRFRPPI